MFLFDLEIVNKMRQVSVTIYEFTDSIKQRCGRCDIKLIYMTVYSPHPSVFKFCYIQLENVKNCSPSLQDVAMTL